MCSDYPQRHFAIVIYRIATASFTHVGRPMPASIAGGAGARAGPTPLANIVQRNVASVLYAGKPSAYFCRALSYG